MTSQQQNDCFTGFPATIQHEGSFDKVNCETWDGKYYIYSHIYSSLIEKLNSINFQGLANCAKVTLEYQNQGLIVFWKDRNSTEEELEEVKKHISKQDDIQKITFLNYEDYFEQEVDHSQKSFKLLEHVGKKLSTLSAFAEYGLSPKDCIICGIPYVNPNYFREKSIAPPIEWRSVLQGLIEEKLISSQHQPVTKAFSITTKGWEHLRTRKKNLSNKVFIAMAFQNKWTDPTEFNAVQDAIKKACQRLGYDANIVSQNHTDNISHKILAEIKDAHFVVADFTYNNRGVYFEAGYARALGLNVFHLIKKGHTKGKDEEGKLIHFDIAQINYREWNATNEIEEMLYDWIKSVIGEFNSNKI